MKNEIIIFLFLLKYIVSAVPNYVLIKRHEKIIFNFEEKNSSFYSYLDFEQDYEEEDFNENYLYYFLKLNEKIGIKSKIVDNFPDESEFNKTSKEERDSTLPYFYIEEEKTQLVGYEKFKKGNDTKLIVFVFYIKEEYYNNFDKNENFTVERINNAFYFNESTYEVKLNPGEIRLMKALFLNEDDFYHYHQYIFINSPFSQLYANYTTTKKKIYYILVPIYFYINFFIKTLKNMNILGC